MRKGLHTIIYLLISLTAISQNTYEVLWIGNSYTGVNNLPQLTKDIAASTNDVLINSSSTPGGSRLLTHAANNSVAMNLIDDKKWDFVTIQAQSQEPSWNSSQVNSSVFPYAKILCDSIYSNYSCSKPIFYMTWGRENGDAFNCANWPPVCTYNGMDSILNQNYQTMAIDNNALVSPVGAVWHYLRDNHPTIGLYSSDGSHPSQAGSYAAALTFYTMFTEKNPTLVTYNYTVNSTDAAIMKSAVEMIVYDSLSNWNHLDNVINTEVTYNTCDSIEINGNWIYSDTTISEIFANQSQIGCDSIVKHIVHYGLSQSIDTTLIDGNNLIFDGVSISDSGTFQFDYKTINGCDSIIYLNVTLLPNGINTGLENIVKFYPNPFNKYINIENKLELNLTIKIINSIGELIYINDVNTLNYKVNLTDHPNGIYYLSITDKVNSISEKVMKY